MKKFLFPMFIVAILAATSNAQDTVRTLIHLNKIRNFGLYFAPEYQYGQSNAVFTSFSGASSMIIFNKRLAIGVAGYESVMDEYAPKGVSPLTLKTAYGGAKMEYTVRPDAAIHVSFPLLVGMGEAKLDSVRLNNVHENHNDRNENESNMNADFFVMQPGINLEANLLRNIKMFVGANYRITSKISTATTLVPSDALSGFSMSAGVRMGIFDVRKPHFHVRKFRKHKK
jgi:hypothetical protein